jgi:hypothetical protein
MGTTAAILGLLSVVVPFLIWVYKRHEAKQDDPVFQKEKKDEELEKAIATNDVDAINVFVHDKLQDKGSSNSGGSSNKI